MPLFPPTFTPRKPTSQTFLSGSGTYTTPANVSYIVVEMVGGGAGGNGSAITSLEDAGLGTNGGNTTFGTSLLTAGGGQAPVSNTNEVGGAGGSASLGSGPFGLAIPGTYGGGTSSGGSVSSAITAPRLSGADGGNSPVFNGGGRGGYGNDPNNTGAGIGQDGTANTGGGGGGGGLQVTNAINGAAGGSGGYVKATITNPLPTYSYSVGAGGTAGAAGTSGVAGGNGGSGMIIVWEF